jgi:hypothetical protein
MLSFIEFRVEWLMIEIATYSEIPKATPSVVRMAREGRAER